MPSSAVIVTCNTPQPCAHRSASACQPARCSMLQSAVQYRVLKHRAGEWSPQLGWGRGLCLHHKLLLLASRSHLLRVACLGVLDLGMYRHDLCVELACCLCCSCLAVAGCCKLVLHLPAGQTRPDNGTFYTYHKSDLLFCRTLPTSASLAPRKAALSSQLCNPVCHRPDAYRQQGFASHRCRRLSICPAW